MAATLTDLMAPTVANVSVEWLLKNVTDALDRSLLLTEVDWLALISYKMGDSGDEFVDSVLREGVRQPICIAVNYESLAYSHHPEPDEHGLTFTLGNGHHRLALAILGGLDTVPCYFAFDNDFMHSNVTSSADFPSAWGGYSMG